MGYELRTAQKERERGQKRDSILIASVSLSGTLNELLPLHCFAWVQHSNVKKSARTHTQKNFLYAVHATLNRKWTKVKAFKELYNIVYN